MSGREAARRALVTGATGFVGANLARALLARGHAVHLLVRPRHRSWRIQDLRGHVRLHEAHLSDPDAVDRAVRAIRPEWIFHLAAHGAYPHQNDLRRMVATNVQGTANLLQACLDSGFEAFVNAGTSSEYGLKDHPPSELEALEPNSHYAATKASATWLCRYTGRSRGLHIATLRLYSVYGPWEEPTRLVPALVLEAFEGRLPPLVRPTVARDFVYVDDAVEAFLAAASAPGQEPGAVYNVGSGRQTTLAEAVEVARRVFRIDAEPRWGEMQARHWDAEVWVSDPSRIRAALGWRAQTSLEDGLGATARFLRSRADVLETYRRIRAGAQE